MEAKNLDDPHGDRKGFIIKTYSIISAMLSVTILFTVIIMTDAIGDSKKFVYGNLWLYYLSLIMVIGIMVGMTCFYKKCR